MTIVHETYRYPHFLDSATGVPYPHFSGWKGEEFAVICCQQRQWVKWGGQWSSAPSPCSGLNPSSLWKSVVLCIKCAKFPTPIDASVPWAHCLTCFRLCPDPAARRAHDAFPDPQLDGEGISPPQSHPLSSQGPKVHASFSFWIRTPTFKLKLRPWQKKRGHQL